MTFVNNRWARIAIGLVALGLLALLPNILGIGGMLGPLSSVQAGSLAVIFGLGILSVVILTGYVGQVSLCQATFMGVSAFGTAWLVNSGLNYWVAAVAGVVMAASLGIVVGVPALRLRGILLAIVTLGVALSFDNYFFQDDAFRWFNGGLSGWAVDQVNLFGLTVTAVDADQLRPAYYLLLAVFAIVAVPRRPWA
jgi:sulfate-transporting ATPase